MLAEKCLLPLSGQIFQLRHFARNVKACFLGNGIKMSFAEHFTQHAKRYCSMYSVSVFWCSQQDSVRKCFAPLCVWLERSPDTQEHQELVCCI